MIFMLVYVMFSFWIQICRKLYFTNLANPKNPNLNLDLTDYGCEIRLMCQAAIHCKIIFQDIFNKIIIIEILM